jgi:peptidoglycan/xylan/chitin deacetylase (PgdA/CDA1 family)
VKYTPNSRLFFSFLLLILPATSIPKIYTESDSNFNFVAKSINNSAYSKQDFSTSESKDFNSTEKAVIIIFDRGYKSQFTNAKPILDKYGFKASFFVICSYIDDNGYYKLSRGREILIDPDNAMNWDQIRQLDKEGHNIESHGMEHKYLKNLTSEELEYEVSGSKECLEDHGLKPTYFQFPNNKGADNATLLNIVSKYFDFALAGHSKLMFLNCDGWVNHGYKTKGYKYQYDCNPYSVDGTPTRTHKLAIKEWTHDRYHNKLNNKYPLLSPLGDGISNMLFIEFVRTVEAQTNYNNKAGKIVAVPLIGYHSIDNSTRYDTTVELFDREMKYLYDNEFKVLTLTDLGYNEKENYFYIK